MVKAWDGAEGPYGFLCEVLKWLSGEASLYRKQWEKERRMLRMSQLYATPQFQIVASGGDPFFRSHEGETEEQWMDRMIEWGVKYRLLPMDNQ